MLPDIRSQTRDDLEARFKAWELPPFRVGQLLKWLYEGRVTSWEAMTNLPKALRERLRAVLRSSAGVDTPYIRILRRWVPE